VVGKHSGSRTIYRKFQEFGIELSDHDASEILKMVRQTAIELKRALFSKEIMYIYQDYIASLAAAADAPPAGAPAGGSVAATPAARD
jgi:homocitrate synthase NifV